MEQRTEMNPLLSMMIQPGFCVREGRITEVNDAARRLLVSTGDPVEPLLATGREEYAAFSGGCLYLQLKLGDQPRGAAVLRREGCNVFLLEPETENSELYALALAAQDLRGSMSSLMIAADQVAPGETAERLNRGLHRLLRTVNNMSDALLFTDLRQQQTRNLRAVFAEIFEKAEAQLAEAGIRLHYQGLEEDLFALADEAQLERAVLNLLSNAAKFGGGTITAALTRRGETLRLSILDNGPGIRPNILDQIFSRYLRHPGIEDSRFGLGLGMVLVRTAAANHGGTVLIDQPGTGTRVTLTLSLRRSDASTLRSPVLHVDYTGGLDHGLVEFSQTLPSSMYGKK